MSLDEEKQGPVDELVGFARVADFVADDKEHTSSIYRRFERLAARNLLYLQAELLELETELDEFDQEDARGDVDVIEVAMDWRFLCEQARQHPGGKAARRKKLILRLRAKIREYEEAVLRNSQVLSLQRPSGQVFKAFRDFFTGNDQQHPFPRLAGLSATTYDNRNDLVSLVQLNEHEDRLSSFLRQNCPTVFRRRRNLTSGRQRTHIDSLSEYRLSLFVGLIDILVAAGMLFGAIYNLYYVTDQSRRLGLIAGYTVGFAVCVGLLTNARRSEIFGASAAYAAVLVVFVSGGLANASS